MNEQAPIDDVVLCGHCGAEVRSSAGICWLCKSDLSQQPEIVMAELVREHAEGKNNPAAFSLASLMAIVTLAAVGFGIFRLAPGLGA